MPEIIKRLAHRSPLGLAFNGLLLALVIGLGALIAATAIRGPRSDDPLTNMELRAALISAGLTAEPLATAGLSPEQVEALVDAARAHLAPRIQPLRDAHFNVQVANRALADLQRAVRQGGVENPAGRLAQARSAITTALAARQAYWDGLFNAAVAESGQTAPTAPTVLRTIHANSGWKLPTQYLAVNREEAAWVALRDALDNIRVAEQLGTTPSEQAQQTVAQAQQASAVAQALVNLGNLPAVSQAWETATLAD
ncbi:MAG: hypothetical protein KF699_09365 [Phycisphaeraceae bacterium]|nr:hypothetical protein [Phycisphaeraceae bacterium]